MIRYAIVGCGFISHKHIDAINNTSNAELIAVCDNNVKQLEAFVKKYNVKGYLDLNEMLMDTEIDVVNICTPSGTHKDICVEAANTGKHVIVEKPMAMSIEEADIMINVTKKNRVKLAVVHPNRFRPAITELRKKVSAGSFGKLSHASATVRWNRNDQYYGQSSWRGTKRSDGGVLKNQAIHNLDLLIWLMGPVKELFTYSATRFRNIETEDVAVSTLKFHNGTLGVVEAAVTVYPENLEESISLFGEKGTAVIRGRNANLIDTWRFEEIGGAEADDVIRRIEQDPIGKPGHQAIVEDFTAAVLNSREPIVTGEDGREVLRLVLAMEESADTNKVVKLI